MLLDTIKCAKLQDHDAMMEIIERFDRLLRKYARLLRYEDAYEDLVVELIDFIQKFQPDHLTQKNDGAIVNYMCTAIYNKYIALSKRQSAIRTLEVPVGDLSEEQQHMVERSMTAPANELLDLTAYLSDKILTPQQQKIIMLHYYEQLPIAEIAAGQGVSRQNVNKAKRTALAKLKKAMLE